MMKHMKHIFCWGLILCLLVSVIPAGEADAAAKKFVRGTPMYDEDYYLTSSERRVEVNGLYFWHDYENERLFCSKSADGKAYELHLSSFSSRKLETMILTDGTWVYYILDDYANDRSYICREKYDGTGFQKVVTFNSAFQNPQLVSIYKNVLYYNLQTFHTTAPYGDKLYSVGLKSGTKKLRTSKLRVSYSTGSGRYIYGTSKSESGTITLKAYDCKEKKVNKIVAFKSGEGGILGIYDGKLYYYKGHPETNDITVYRTTLSGTGKRIKAATLPTQFMTADMVENRIYFDYPDDGGHPFYDVSTGEIGLLKNEDEYRNALLTNYEARFY